MKIQIIKNKSVVDNVLDPVVKLLLVLSLLFMTELIDLIMIITDSIMFQSLLRVQFILIAILIIRIHVANGDNTDVDYILAV